MGDLRNFGRIVADLRKTRGLTQDELAAILNITPQAVSKWETSTGLPDITLLPKIAAALQVPIEALFGVDETGEARFPERYEGLSFIWAMNGTACYSDKRYEKQEGSCVIFTDGSSADLTKGLVSNCGRGEIRLIKIEDCDNYRHKERGEELFDKTFGEIDSLALTLSFSCDVKVHRSGPAGRVMATGTPLFISHLDIKHEGERLSVKVKSPIKRNFQNEDNKIDIYTGFERGNELKVKIDGSSDVVVEPDFSMSCFAINGSGDISAENTGKFEAAVNGSGDIKIKEAGDAVIKINGSGDVECTAIAQMQLRINGSGDVSVGEAKGNMDLRIAGSGDVTCDAGEIDKLTAHVSGSGSLSADKLTVREAEITVQGSSDMTIGRIIEKSVEKLSRGAKLKVLKRG